MGWPVIDRVRLSLYDTMLASVLFRRSRFILRSAAHAGMARENSGV
jgi:hypothetical protein